MPEERFKMGKIAFVFSGQGAQYPGMGKDIYEKYPAARKVLDAFEALHPGLLHLMFESEKEELMKTANTQIALYAFERAVSAVISEHIRCDAAAGFSLGEISALAEAGIVSDEDGFRLTEERGRIMQKAAEKTEAAMLAVLKLSDEETEAIASSFSAAYPVNYNAPGQVVVSLLSSEEKAFAAAVKEKGGRTMKLSVSGGFHSPFMEEAASEFEKILTSFVFSKPSIPIWSNVTGKEYEEDIKDLLSLQISSPVRWKDEIIDMKDKGYSVFIEIGPGNTLTNLIRRIYPEAEVFPVGTEDDIEKAIGGLSNE